MSERAIAILAPHYRRLTGPGAGAVLVRGALAALAVGVFARFVRFPVNIVLARALGTDEFGIYILAGEWMALPSLLALIGFPTALVRYVAAYRATEDWPALRGLLRRAKQIILLTSVLSASAMFLGVFLLRGQMEESFFRSLLVATALIPLASQRTLRIAGLRGLRKIGTSQLLGGVAQPLLVAISIGTFLLVTDGRILSYEAMLVRGGTGLVLFGVGAVLLGRALPPEVHKSAPVYATKEWVSNAFPLMLVSGLETLLTRSDVILIGILIGPAEAGIYAIATNTAQITSFGLVAINSIAGPLIAELHARKDMSGLQRIYSLTVWGSTASAAGLGALLILLKLPLLGLYGGDFQEGSTVLLIIVAVLIVDAWTGPNGSLLNMTGHGKKYAVIVGTTSLLNVLVGVPVIIAWGVEGAAVLTGVANISRNAWTWFEVRRTLGINSSIFGPLPALRG